MQLKKVSIKGITEIQKICIAAYSFSFHPYWNEGGLVGYLDKEFSTERLTFDLADVNTEYFFIRYEGKNVGFIKIRNNSISNLPIESCMELEKI